MRSNKRTTSIDELEQLRCTLTSHLGRWQAGVDVSVRDKSLFADIIGSQSYFQFLIYSVTGREASKALGDMLECIYMCTSYPDSRIWCNQIAALTSCMDAPPNNAVAAGVMAADSRIYGAGQSAYKASKFIQQSLQQFKQGMTVADIVESQPNKQGLPAIIGFARPIKSVDERVGPMRAQAQKLGFEVGEHMQLGQEIEHYMLEHYDIGMNIGGFSAAFLSDQGFTPTQVYSLKSIATVGGLLPCYVDFQGRGQTGYLPLHCDDVVYQGHPARPLPQRYNRDSD